jgi:PAS domain S-box-containing protein
VNPKIGSAPLEAFVNDEAPDPHRHPHSVQFYSDDKYLISVLARFIGSAVGAGDAAIVIATPPHRTELAERLSARGIDVARAAEQGRYVALDAEQTLTQFMVGGWPDEARFVEVMGEIVSHARSAVQDEHGRLALFGEMVALLWNAGNSEAALRLEQLWNLIAQSHSFSLVCGYPLTHFYREEHGELFQKICAEHSAVIPDENYSQVSEEQRLRSIAEWQRKALVLEAEIARRKQAEMDSRKLGAIVESSDDAIASKDLNGIVSSWNAAAERIFGYRAEEIIGKSIKLIIPPELHDEEGQILARIRRGERIEHYETVRLTKSGERIDIALTISPVKDDHGQVIGAAKIARDITHRKRAEEALRRAEKLALTGRMVLMLSHEINNPLEAVTNALFLLRGRVQGDEGIKYLAMAESELERVADITKQTLAFYRQRSTPETVNLAELIGSLIPIFTKRITEKRLMLVRRESVVTVRGIKGELRHLFSNLLDNAVEAIPANGKIEVEVSRQHSHAVVSVADNGSGIKPEHLQKLFEPFFTTKELHGTGLGLWVAQEIARKHGGHITAQSSTCGPNRGTTFRVVLEGIRDDEVSTTTTAAGDVQVA